MSGTMYVGDFWDSVMAPILLTLINVAACNCSDTSDEIGFENVLWMFTTSFA